MQSLPKGPESPALMQMAATTAVPVTDGDRRMAVLEAGHLSIPGGTAATTIRAAWAILLSIWTGSERVLFGTVGVKRNVATSSEFPRSELGGVRQLRFTLAAEMKVDQLLRDVAAQELETVQLERRHITEVGMGNAEHGHAYLFQSLLVTNPVDLEDEPQLGRSKGNPTNCSLSPYELGTWCVLLNCQISAYGLDLQIMFDPGFLDVRRLRRMAHQLQDLSLHLCNEALSQTCLIDLEIASERDLSDIWRWNATVPDRTNALVHHLISATAQRQLTAPAVHAWDGDLSYGELDSLSSRLGAYLRELGVGPETKVPLCAEKSLWVPVAMLAIMKAGGVSVVLDATHPFERLQVIIRQVQPVVILSLVNHDELAKKLGLGINMKNFITVDKDHILRLPPPRTDVHPRENISVQPTNSLYLVFTSGSTGTPKGVVITHSNFASALTHQASIIGMSKNSRVVDLTSCGFDGIWYNAMHTFYAGGLLCIPHDDERKENPSEAIKKFKGNFLGITPTVANVLDDESLQLLDTIHLSGENPSPTLISRLKQNAKKALSLYGPSECCCVATFPQDLSPNYIGHGLGVNAWIVDPVSGARLTPVGVSGELWLEGPLVGRGYLDLPEQTAAAFVEDPQWLAKGHLTVAGRRGRLYRTGDLVQYNEDGSLNFIGRKGTQVKLRGQRIELNEVEHHVSALLIEHLDVRVIAEVIIPEDGGGETLVVFVTPAGAAQMDEQQLHAEVIRITNGIDERLAKVVPVYMIPSAYIPLANLHMTGSGKTDRRSLRAFGASAISVSRSMEGLILPSNTTESKLLGIWASVLNHPSTSLSVEARFTRIGGDSINAMRIVSLCRKEDMRLKIGDLLGLQTIRKISDKLRFETSRSIAREENKSTLLPSQQRFFDTHPDGALDHSIKSFALELSRHTAGNEVLAASRAVVGRHEMLRARFRETGKQWELDIAAEGPDAFAFQQHAVTRYKEIETIARSRQRSFNIVQGPVFAVDFFDIPGRPQILWLSAHELTIDVPSWNVIWQDFEKCLAGKPLGRGPARCELWNSICSNSPQILLPQEKSTDRSIDTAEPSFWGLADGENKVSLSYSWDDHLATEASKFLLGRSTLPLRTNVEEIILAAMYLSFQATFQHRAAPTISVESHDRTDFVGAAMVGNLTTCYTLQAPIEVSVDAMMLLRVIKDLRRHTLSKALPVNLAQSEIFLTYSGSLDQTTSAETLLTGPRSVELHNLHLEKDSPDTVRKAPIEVDALFEGERLTLRFTISKWIRHHTRLRQWARSTIETIEHMSTRFANMSPVLTLSDLPLLKLSHSNLDLLMKQLLETGVEAGRVRDAYPCTPLQQGILNSQTRGIGSYIGHSIWECHSHGQTISAGQLKAAWTATTDRHPIFSTIFMENPATGAPIQILLTHHKTRIVTYSPGKTPPRQFLQDLAKPTMQLRDPQWEVSICQSDDGKVACRMDISHALIDASSTSVIVRDVTCAYNGHKLPAAPPFRAVIKAVQEIPQESRLEYWSSYLKGVQPCEIPTIDHTAQRETPNDDHTHTILPIATQHTRSRISSFCAARDITRSMFLQLAWALTLSYCTGMDKVCFGFIASGRDVDIEDAEEVCGPLLNMLVGCVDLQDPFQKALEAVRHDSIEHLANQHISLAEIQHKLRLEGKRLFNTLITSHNASNLRAETGAFRMTETDAYDPQEYEMVLYAVQDGQLLNLELSYRTSITHSQAHEIASVFEAAIEFILTDGPKESGIGPSIEQETSLRSRFFKWRVGVDEDAATAYWSSQLVGAEVAHFPPPVSLPHCSKTSCRVLERDTCAFQYPIGDLSPTTIMWAAWGILTAAYTGSNDVVFGADSGLSLRDEFATGRASRSVAPVRILLELGASTEELFSNLQKQEADIKQYGRIGWQPLRRLGDGPRECCDFQTVVSIKSFETHQSVPTPDLEQWRHCQGHWSTWIVCAIADNVTKVRLYYDSVVLSEERAARILQQLDHLLQRLGSSDTVKCLVQDLSRASEGDIQNVMAWNAQPPAASQSYVDEAILETIQRQPHVQAVDAWDGSLTYGELDLLSTQLSHHLVDVGLSPEAIVPLCFEKSMWTPVAMLGVMKARAASLALDMNLPEDRLRALVGKIRPKIILSSTSHQITAAGFQAGCMIIPVGRGLFDGLSPSPSVPSLLQDSRQFDPARSALYLVFTSGSTGAPKGILITHENISSAFMHQTPTLGLSPGSRVIDFSSYAFDVAWYNTLHTLYSGGILCIPRSGSDRSEAVRSFKPNFVNLTPTGADVLDDDALQHFETMELIGEVASTGLVARLRDGPKCRNTYGPSEYTTWSTVSGDLRTPSHIGKGVGVRTWVVGPSGQHLTFIGGVGELWLEGPLLARGYYNDEEKTRAAFVEDPSWMIPEGPALTPRRAYRTGDLVRYEEDGSLTFVGRNDVQVKIRGQRLELGEVEYNIQQLLNSDKNPRTRVVAEAIKPANQERLILVAFVALIEETDERPDSQVAQLTQGLNQRLSKLVPAFMVPSMYIPLARIPLTATGKTDRKRLGAMGSAFTAENRPESDLGNRQPRTTAEQQLRSLWASVLSLDEATIGADDSFMRIGGDSIHAMQLAAAARAQGFSFNMEDVLRRPQLSEMATKRTGIAEDRTDDTVPPFSMLPVKDPNGLVEQYIMPQLPRGCGTVMDVFPAAYVQSWYLSRPETGLIGHPNYFFIDFPAHIDIQGLVDALKGLVNHFEILRAIFLCVSGSLYQVIPATLEVPIDIDEVEGDMETASGQAWKDDFENHPLKMGQPFARFMILQNKDCIRLIFRTNHAQYDGVGFAYLTTSLGDLYRRQPLPSKQPFVNYVHYALQKDREKAYGYWRSLLRGSSMSFIGNPARFPGGNRSIISRSKTIPVPFITPSGDISSGDFTAANIFTAACGLMMMKLTKSQDVLFGNVVTGRNALPADRQAIVGPCANVIPVRLQLRESEDPVKLLQSVKVQQLDSLPFEAVGMTDIIQNCTDWPAMIRDFWCFVQYRNFDATLCADMGNGVQASFKSYEPPVPVYQPPSHILEVIATPKDGELFILMDGGSQAFDEGMVESVLEDLCAAIASLSQGSSRKTKYGASAKSKHATGIEEGTF